MAKFPFKRPRIISKKFPGVNSTIDGVSKSLNELVFSYSKQVDQTLQKKHLMMAFSSIVLLIVLGSFISPKGKADSSIFFPETCLGGWVNPQYAQGEQETTSNGDESQFTKDNSAVLPKNTNAEMYCGNFKGKFDGATRPTKIIVSLALTKGKDLTAEDTMESGLSASSSPDALLASTTIPSLLDASSTASSTVVEGSVLSENISASTTASTTTTIETASSSETGDANATPTPIVAPDVPPSVMDGIIESVKDTIRTIFETGKDAPIEGTTDTVVVPPPAAVEAPVPTPAPEPVTAPVEATTPTPPPSSEADVPAAPTSYFNPLLDTLLSIFSQKVFAQEVLPSVEGTPTVTPADIPTAPSDTSPTPSDVLPSSIVDSPLPVIQTEVTPLPEVTSPQTVDAQAVSPSPLIILPEVIDVPVIVSTSSSEQIVGEATTEGGTSTVLVATSSLDVSTSTFDSMASSTIATTTIDTATTTEDENQFQNNFLEVFYTFDGVTWISLGELNEISMKYRTFEIPVTATTSWVELSQLQVKIVAKRHLDETPTVYLDAIKVEVLYESELLRAHPDFARDTILKDETVHGMRIVTIINNENNLKEIWYMYLEDASSTQVADATSTEALATSTLLQGSSSEMTSKILESTIIESPLASSTSATTTSATSTPPVPPVSIKPVLPKNIWMKYKGEIVEGISGESLAHAILVADEVIAKEEEEKKRALPDFSLDEIKRIKGTVIHAIFVQLKKENNNELWIYDLEKNTQEKITAGSSTSISENSPLGEKDNNVFWLSSDEGKVFAYNIISKEIKEQIVPPYDVSKGERAEIVFDGIPWKILIGGTGFSFFSQVTGEVFSDDNGSMAEAIRQKFKLDTVLSKEQLSNLNFQVEDSGESNVTQP